MKVLKVLVALIFACGLFCAQCVLMGALAGDKAVSPGSVAKAVQSTGLTGQLCQQALTSASGEAASKLGGTASGETGEYLQKVFETDAVADFVGEYTSSAINASLTGQHIAPVTEQDLQQLADDGLDELAKDPDVDLSKDQRRSVDQYVAAHGSSLTSEINSKVSAVSDAFQGSGQSGGLAGQTSLGDTGTAGLWGASAVGSSSASPAQSGLAILRGFLHTPIQLMVAAVCLLLGIILLILFWRSKMGFIWWAAVSFLAGVVFCLLGGSSSLIADLAGQATGDPVTGQLAAAMFGQGLLFSGLGALLLTAVLVVLCLISRKVSRR